MGPLACNVMSFKIWFLFCGCIEDTSYTLEYFRAANSQVRPLVRIDCIYIRNTGIRVHTCYSKCTKYLHC